ncbi:MAG: hypothetical protein EOO28_14060 [Comamonadaceae bacterium]|nr:MAG: hypothetical protein EOO28_14060 [Comamonadaceae bacterium]
MKNLSNWRSVRVWEGELERELRQRHSLRLHGACIGALTLCMIWAVSYVLMRLGHNALALRYLASLGAGYLFYLLLLWVWARWLLRRDGEDAGDMLDAGADLADVNLPDLPFARAPQLRSGRGGDFGGGGATADYSGPATADTGAAGAGSGLGDAAGGALELAAGVDEGAVVVVPVVAVFLIGAAVLFGAGSLLMLFAGWEVLLAVAIELAFSYAAARTSIRVMREGWMSAAVRLTWKPLLGALACAVVLGWAIDHFVPAADSLPQAIKLLAARPTR